MNAPKLRFKEFTDDWKSDKISNLTTYVDYRGKTPVKTETGIFLITAKNVKKGYIDYNCSKEYVEASQYNAIMHRGLPKVGDVLVTTEAPCGNVAQIDNANVALAQRIIKYRGNDLINNDFLKYELLSDYFQTELKRVASGGTVYGVKGSTLHQMSINYCSKEEQTKIAQFLSLLDKKIELQKRKIKALKLFKKGLFDIQLKINGKESIMFDDFLDEVTEKSSIQNQYPVLSSTSKGLFLQSDYFNKQASSENNVGYKILKRNQLVLSPQNLWMGNININNIFDIGIVSPSYRVYNIDIKKMDLNYFNYWIKTPKALYSYLISSEQGASIVRRNLNIEMFNQISLKIPNLEKQHIIGNRIYQFDLKINLEEEKLKLLYKLKKGLMQKMFI